MAEMTEMTEMGEMAEMEEKDYMNVLPDIVRDIHHIFDTTPGYNCNPSKRQLLVNDGFCTWSQCEDGLILLYYYGFPSEIITPYGNLRISGTVFRENYESSKIVDKRISELLSLSLYNEKIENDFGSHGPWYRITSYKGMDIPTSNIIKPVTISSDDAKRKFNSIFN